MHLGSLYSLLFLPRSSFHKWCHVSHPPSSPPQLPSFCVLFYPSLCSWRVLLFTDNIILIQKSPSPGFNIEYLSNKKPVFSPPLSLTLDVFQIEPNKSHCYPPRSEKETVDIVAILYSLIPSHCLSSFNIMHVLCTWIQLERAPPTTRFSGLVWPQTRGTRTKRVGMEWDNEL